MEELSPCLSNSSVTAERIVTSNCIELSSSLPENRRIESRPIRAAGYGDCTVQDFKWFKNSSSPSRFLHFQENAWVDFPKHVFDELSTGFIAGKAVLELSIHGTCYLFDFLRMIKIDTSTEAAESMAWIDVNGRCFFPTTAVQNHQLNHRREIPMTIERSNGSFSGNFGTERVYKMVEELFLNGMRRGGCNAVVTKVQRCLLNSGLSGRLRLKVFGMMDDITKKARGGVANAKFGWYGASAEDVADVVKHGFGKANSGELGLRAHGIGVHLSPANSPYESSLLSRADPDDERHIVLCRVIMGNSERVESGSLQSHPSNDKFDSGVDDLEDPKWYVLWTTGMNTRIVPVYIVSFTSSLDQPHGVVRRPVGSARRRPTFHNLLVEIGKTLPSSRMHSLVMLYKQHKAGKIRRGTFFRCFRSMVDDKLLASAIRRVKTH